MLQKAEEGRKFIEATNDAKSAESFLKGGESEAQSRLVTLTPEESEDQSVRDEVETILKVDSLGFVKRNKATAAEERAKFVLQKSADEA